MLFALMLAIPMAAQDTVTMVMVPKNTLTAQQKQVVEVQSAREWVGLGKEVGEAINSSLSAVTEQTSKFAETKVGHLTMALVVWKVVGRELLHFCISAILFVLVLPMILWSLRKYIGHKFLKKENFGADGKITSKEYGETESDGEPIGFHFLLMLILVGVCSLIAFSG
jgi:hypothetical protein